MKRLEFVQRDFFGGHLDCIRYESLVKSTHELVFHPGTDELGIGDGSQLFELDKYGFPGMAKNGFEFGFNITCIQPVKTYSGSNKIILPWVSMEFKPSAVITLGISLGAIACLDQLTNDKYSVIKGVVSLSGKPSASNGIADAVARMRHVPGYAYHGMKDTRVDFNQAKKFYQEYNAAMTNPNTGFITDYNANQAHGGWDEVMREGGPLIKWINSLFGNESNNDYEVGIIDGLNLSARLALTEIAKRTAIN